MDKLTEDEVVVLRLTALGLSRKEISANLHYSMSWVAKKLECVRDKLDTKNEAHSVYVGIREGYVDAGRVQKRK